MESKLKKHKKTPEQKLQDDEKESLFLVSNYAKDYFKKSLLSEEGKSIGLSYLKERNFDQKMIDRFEIGYSPEKINDFSDAAVNAGYKINFLEKTGLTIVKEDKQIDRFRSRIIFPIKSMSGRVLGFGGRILDNSKKNIAKYINSPESLIYQKVKFYMESLKANNQL